MQTNDLWRLGWLILVVSCAPTDPDDAVQPRPANAPWSVPTEPGPYAVGATTLEVTDARGVELTLEVWYPAVPAPGAQPEDYGDLSLVRAAFRDAPLDARADAFPLVAFSHGFGGIRYQSTFLTEHLASHGFVVVAPDHPNNTLFDLDSDLTDAVALARPGDISSAVDAIVALERDDPAWQGSVQTDRFAMVGHSFGGWTSLAVSGGQLDVAAAESHCAETPTASCDFFDLSGVTDTSNTTPDDRVVAMAALAPGGAYTFDGMSLAGIDHALVIGGQRDGDMPYDSEIRPAFDRLPSGARLVTLARSGHWAFTDLCELLDVFDDCQGESANYMEADVVQDITNTLVTAHLRAVMLESQADVPYVEAGHWQATEDVAVEVRP